MDLKAALLGQKPQQMQPRPAMNGMMPPMQPPMMDMYGQQRNGLQALLMGGRRG